MKNAIRLVLFLALLLTGFTVTASAYPQQPEGEASGPAIQLQSRIFVPAVGLDPAARSLVAQEDDSVHLLIQFYGVVTEAQQELLKANGVTLLGYIPQNAWLAGVSGPVDLAQFRFIRWAGPLQAADKIAPGLTDGRIGNWAVDEQERVTLQVLFFADVDREAAARLLIAQGGTILQRNGQVFVARFPDKSAVGALADLDPVQWIDNGPAPRHERTLPGEILGPQNDASRDRTNVTALQNAHPGAIGTGVRVAILDGLVDVNHPDFTGRLTIDAISHGGNTTADDHGTHVAGTVGGDGSNSQAQGGTANQWRGVAFGASLFSFSMNNVFYDDHQRAIQTNNADVSSNSWGGNFTSQTCDFHNNYSLDAQQMDQIAAGAHGKRIAISVAASNFRQGTSDDEDNDTDPICGYSDEAPFLNYFSLSDLGSAKNIITVGATRKDTADSMAAFSSWGPTKDGRLKPDVSAPGEDIFSTLPGGGYGTQSGTSMATPHVSGVAALVIQRYRTVFDTQNVNGETIKAILIQTAKDLVGSDDVAETQQYYHPGPDYASGYGIVDAWAAYNAIAQNTIFEGQIAHGQTLTQTIQVTDSNAPLKVTVAWNDPASQPNTCNALNCTLLINNLDLELVAPDGGVHLPWILDPNNPAAAATRGVDNRNPVEQVQVDSPMTGVWTIRLKGTNIAAGPQAYAAVSSAPAFTQQAPPTLAINYTSGAPGSFFTLTGANYNADTAYAIIVNGHDLGDVQTDSNGNFSVILTTDDADLGDYRVMAVVAPPVTPLPPGPVVRFTLNQTLPVRPQQGSGLIIQVPNGIAIQLFDVFLPLIMRQ